MADRMWGAAISSTDLICNSVDDDVDDEEVGGCFSVKPKMFNEFIDVLN